MEGGGKQGIQGTSRVKRLERQSISGEATTALNSQAARKENTELS